MNIDSLIKAVCLKTGMPEAELREAVSSGNISAVKKYLGNADSKMLDKAMNDRELAEKLKKQYMGNR